MKKIRVLPEVSTACAGGKALKGKAFRANRKREGNKNMYSLFIIYSIVWFMICDFWLDRNEIYISCRYRCPFVLCMHTKHFEWVINIKCMCRHVYYVGYVEKICRSSHFHSFSVLYLCVCMNASKEAIEIMNAMDSISQIIIFRKTELIKLIILFYFFVF